MAGQADMTAAEYRRIASRQRTRPYTPPVPKTCKEPAQPTGHVWQRVRTGWRCQGGHGACRGGLFLADSLRGLLIDTLPEK